MKTMPDDINQINTEMRLSKYKSLNANQKKANTNFEKKTEWQGPKGDASDKPWLKKKFQPPQEKK